MSAREGDGRAEGGEGTTRVEQVATTGATFVSGLDFLRHVLPEDGHGHFCIATPRAKAKTGWDHFPCDTLDQAYDKAMELRQSKDVYFPVGTLKKRKVWDKNKRKGEGDWAYRIHTNMAWFRCLILDLDCGFKKDGEQKDYPSQRTAVKALGQFCRKTKLPVPTMVSSGYGVHVYWTFEHAISAAEWRDLAGRFKALLDAHEFKADPSRTTDLSSVLRVVETFNRKDPNTPRPVEVRGGLQPHTAAVELRKRIEAALGEVAGVDVGTDRAGGKPASDNLFQELQARPIVADSKERLPPPTESSGNIAIVERMLACLPPDMAGDRKLWMRVVWAVLATGWDDTAVRLAREWSMRGKLFNKDDFPKVVRSFDPARTGFGTLVTLAEANGYDGPRPGQAGALSAGAIGAGDGTQRPIIMVEKGEIAATASKAEDALRAAGVPIYQRGGKLVVPIQGGVKLASGKTVPTANFKLVDVPTLVDLLNRCADFQRWDARTKKFVSIDPPRVVAETILSRSGEWGFRRVAGCVTAPMLRADGTLLDAPGYDGATELHHFRDPDLIMPTMPEEPTRADAAAALALLDGLLPGFPFVGPLDRAVALSALMTAVLRGGMPTAPMHLIRAHTAGTGKSFLVDLATTLAAGHPAPAMSVGKGAEEMEKRLGAAMLDGSPSLNLDNANGEIGGDMLCQVAERPSVAIRVLGQSKVSHVECRATVFCNGNNTTVVDDLVRRTLTCNLDAGMENPAARRFDFNPIARLEAERGRYLAAVLTISRAYKAAGCPEACPPLAPLGSYAEWERAVRAPLVWLGMPDPVASQDAARAEDPVRASIRELMAHWEATPALRLDTFHKAKAISEAAMGRPDFQDFLLRHCGLSGGVSTKALGTFLSRIHGRVLDGRKIVMRADKARGHLYGLMQGRWRRPNEA